MKSKEKKKTIKTTIREKLAWAKAEKQKGLDILKSYHEKEEKLMVTLNRLEGIILVLTELSELKR